MLRYGLISEVDYSIGRARVNFDDLEIVSDWLTLPKNIKENWFFPVNSQVAVLMHDNGEDGEILHLVPNEVDKDKYPKWANDHVEGIEFADGTKVTYDNSTKKLTVDSTGEIIMNCTKLTVNGTIEATGDVKAGLVSLQNHIHTATTVLTAGSVAVTGTITIAKP
jgi:phage baseplate assembly protein V